MGRSPGALRLWLSAALVIVVAATLTSTGRAQHVDASTDRLPVPEDIYALAGGCYTIQDVASGAHVARSDDGFVLGGDPEPFHFQATDLGRYLVYGTQEDFLASDDSILGSAADEVTGSTAGGYASGLTIGVSDAIAHAAGEGEASDALGRGTEIVSAPEPSELADWELAQVVDGFLLTLPAVEASLTSDGDGLGLAAEGSVFTFALAEGCAAYPEVEVNVEGPVIGGDTSFTEVRGYIDAHLHMMAFEFIGGRSRCGRPWHAYGVAYALVDCPDHEPGGHGAALEMVLSGGDPVNGHDTSGWPTFTGWPRHDSLTHEQAYHKWLERAWRGGLRMMVNLLVDNHALCTVYPYKKNSCNEMDGVRLQAQRIRELERYIDAQAGGPGEGWFRVVTDPFEAREVMNQGDLAVVLGIEVSIPLDCGVVAEQPQCDEEQIDAGLDEVYDLGVRQMELVNKFDNALSGVTGDAGSTGVVVNQGNKLETGKYWQFDTCEHTEHGTDRTQMNFHDESGAPDSFSGRDSIFGGVLALAGTSGAAPMYPEGPHCSERGLTELGGHMVRGMMDRGMIFDPDHMSARARHEALDILENAGYSGVVSSHSWADDSVYRRVYELGGVVTPYAGGSDGFVEKWRKHKDWENPDTYFGFGYGSDVNGFGAQGGARDGPEQVTYPFTGLGGVSIERQVSGTRTYDVNTDGVAHYGLYPDWIEDLRLQAGDAIVEDMARGAEAYLQMWERAVGVTPSSCRDDVPDLTDAQLAELSAGSSPRQVIEALGQPASREGVAFTYCATGGRTATVTFDTDGALIGASAA